MDNTKAEVLRYLGYRDQEITPELDSMITECMITMSEALTPRFVRSTFAIRHISGGVLLDKTAILLSGGDVCEHLEGCGQIVLLAATLGVQADNLIRRWEDIDLTRSLVLDACATQLIEQYCDDIEKNVSREASANGLTVVRRFSPGYGDLPLDVQPRLISLLDAGRKIGLTCTDSFILLPRKSVTAIIGLMGSGGDLHARRDANCEACPSRMTCRFRRIK